ncbi:hypothetical protein C1I98_15185, partial [Spongiactinospora gelatinilytica]
MARRTRALLLTFALTSPALLAAAPGPARFAPAPTVEIWLDAETRADGVPSVELDPDQQVEIRWKGFTPGTRVVISQCRTPDLVGLFGLPSWGAGMFHCAHQIRRYAQTGADGEGKLSTVITTGMFQQTIISRGRGNEPFGCNGEYKGEEWESACVVTVSECEWDQPLTLTQDGTDWKLVPSPRTDLADPALAAASENLRFSNPDGVPVMTDWPPPPPMRVEVKVPDPLPIPERPEGAPISGAGSVNLSEVITDWLISIRRRTPARDVSYLRGTSVFGAGKLKQGFAGGFAEGADFAVVGTGLTPEETGGAVAYAPIALTGLSIANGVEYGGLGLATTRMSAASVTELLGLGTSLWSDSTLKGPTVDDNRGCGLPTLDARIVPRAGQSAQNKLISSWLAASLPPGRFAEVFSSEPGDLWLRPKANGEMYSAENGATAAEYIATLGGKGIKLVQADGKTYQESNAEKQNIGALGFTDITQVAAAREKGYVINSAPVKNAAGRYVLPTKEALLAAFETMTKNADGTYTPVFDRAGEADAYPLPMIHYIAVPAADASGRNPLPLEKRKTLAAFIEHLISDAGQAKAAELGAPALPRRLREQSEEVVRMLLEPGPESPGPTTPPP